MSVEELKQIADQRGGGPSFVLCALSPQHPKDIKLIAAAHKIASPAGWSAIAGAPEGAIPGYWRLASIAVSDQFKPGIHP